MYWRSLWFRNPAADPSARGIFYLAAIAHKKSDDNILSQQATAAALKTERERTKVQAVRATRRAQSARPARDRQASDIIVSIGHNSSLATPDARRWTRVLGNYRTPNHVRSVAELVITALPLVTLWTLAWFTFSLGHGWASFLIAIPAAGFLLRLFMIQHDCGHGTFFADRLANDWVGRVIGVLTLTPYDWWRRTHAIHHATTCVYRKPHPS
jgi:hypothetical protein